MSKRLGRVFLPLTLAAAVACGGGTKARSVPLPASEAGLETGAGGGAGQGGSDAGNAGGRGIGGGATDAGNGGTGAGATDAGHGVDASDASLSLSPVTGLTAAAGTTKVVLTWQNPTSPGFSGVVIRRDTAGPPATPSDGTLVYQGSAATTTDTGLTDGTLYHYSVFASDGASSYSEAATASALPLDAPAVTAAGSDGAVALAWSAVTGATGYQVFRSLTAGFDPAGLTPIASPSAPGYSDTAVTNDTTYYYRVVAIAPSGSSDASPETSATPGIPPAAPTGLLALPGTGKVTLTWSPVTAAAGYVVHRSTSAGAAPTAATELARVTNPAYTDSAVTDHVLYYYVVTAIQGGPESAASNERMGRVPLWKKIAGGRGFSAGLRQDGSLYTTGFNQWGSLGNGTFGSGTNLTIAQRIPLPAGSPAGATFLDVDTGDYHGVVLRSDQTVWTWGDNSYGQMADGTSGTPSLHSTMTQVTFPAAFAGASWKIAAGNNASAALGDGANLLVWGYDRYGGLGLNNPGDHLAPVEVPPPSGVTVWTSIALGYPHSVFLASNGGVYAAGANGAGQLGTGSYTEWHSPLPVCEQYSGSCTLAFTAVTTGAGTPMVAAGYDFSLALRTDGTLWAWGDNFYGVLGGGSTGGNSPLPVQVPLPSGSPGGARWTAIAAGREHALALRSDGTLWAWGRNDYSQLGDVTQTHRNSPVRVCAHYDWTAQTCLTYLDLGASAGPQSFGAAGDHSFAFDANGVLYAWGDNGTGGLGIGASPNTCYPGGAATPCAMEPEVVP